MKKEYLRKIVLLSCIAVLLVIYIVQLLLAGKSGIKSMTLGSDIDTLTVETAGNTVRVEKNGENWLVAGGDSATKYDAAESLVETMVSDVKNLKFLATAAHSVGTDGERYGLDEASRIVVTALSGGKAVRTLYVGKATATNSQNYVQLDSDPAVYIVGETFNRDFNKTVDDVRSKVVYSLDESAGEISKVSADTFTIEKSASSNDKSQVSAWVLAEGTLESGKELDNEKLSSWVSSLSTLTAQSWLPDGSSVPDGYAKAAELSFVAGAKTYSMVLYSGKEGESDSYIMSCSESPDLVKVASYVATRFEKKLSDFAK